MYPKLKALDGYRKAAGDLVNMKDALPLIQDEQISYNVDHMEWYDQKALEDDNPAKGKFEDSVETRKEENAMLALLNDCKGLLQRKTSLS
jgi:hypothetical protein